MNRYLSRMPRATFVVGALALSVLTLGASVAPARLAEPAATAAYAPIEGLAATEVAILPARIDVVGERGSRTVFGSLKQFLARKVQPG